VNEIENRVAHLEMYLLEATRRIKELEKLIRDHSCNYKIGHPLVSEPCPLCKAVSGYQPIGGSEEPVPPPPEE
jgi:hypothetical protein